MALFDGKVAVVTGAAGTIGLAVARMLLEEGAKVALVDVDAMRLDGLARFLRGTTVPVPADVRDGAAVRQAAQQVEKSLGPVDVLVNAATAASLERLEAVGDDEWRRVLDANVDGVFQWSRAVMPGMRKRRSGRIVNVSGPAAVAMGSGGIAEAAARGAVESLTYALAREGAPDGVTVNAVAPAFLKTAKVGEMLNEAQRRQLLMQVPAGRFCEPEEVAAAVRYFASPAAGFVTGQVLTLDGGARPGR